MSGTVTVKLVCGKDLKKQKWIGDNAPYVMLQPYNFNAQNAEWRSPVAPAPPPVAIGETDHARAEWDRGANPTWNNTTTFKYGAGAAGGATLKMVRFPAPLLQSAALCALREPNGLSGSRPAARVALAATCIKPRLG